MEKKYFGTDGIRGKVGQSPITPDGCVRLGWAIGRYFLDNRDEAKILIGKDTRISGYMLESALQSGIISAGATVGLLGPMPTPGIAYLTQKLEADGAIVISASHNPYEDNGIKIFNGKGEKLQDSAELMIESLLAQPMKTVPAAELGKANRVIAAQEQYSDFCVDHYSPPLELNDLKIVVDCANGATYQVAPLVFSKIGLNPLFIASSPDGLNINKDCGSTNPGFLRETIAQKKADIGIAFDGDGDRICLVDHQGGLIDGDDILYLLAIDFLDRGEEFGGVVGTHMTNMAIELAFKEKGIPFFRADVGDRNVIRAMRERGWLLGGEGSGHILNLKKTNTGDGLITALQILEIINREKKSLAEIRNAVPKYPQILRNVRREEPQSLLTNPIFCSEISSCEGRLGNKGRILVRKSGTESLVRIMVEGKNRQEIENIGDHLESVAVSIRQD